MNMSQKVTFQWSRLIRDLETGEADENAVKFYQDVIDECKKNDIILVLNLHHFDLPIELFQKYGGWEIYPKAIYDIAKNVQENYNNIPWFISENGMGVEGEERYINEEGKIEDDYRIDFYEEHLQLLAKAMEEGSNCFGYHAWTGIDCWSWNNAYKNRYGFIALDLETQKRTVKKSGEWLKKVTEEHGYIAKDSYQ